MTPGQTRVLALLGALLALQALINPNVRRVLSGHLNPNEQGGGALGLPGVYIAGYVGVGAAALALVALAGPAPNVATWIVVLFIAMALLEHSDAWRAALSASLQGIQAITGSGASASTGARDAANRQA